ncbi:sacsin-like [Nematostella vectensis]|uniref:sacsin-like n=1 Tax=Nematostella vectensis TaxID=45351 RepID=UPI00207765C8|nr:sacsin-like [Nematostella vectensis]
MDEDSDEDCDLIQPSLIQQIKKILDQYPDDGQILKELIQNAEDAEAREVKVLYDEHSYGTHSLFKPELAKFQGPALYAYNNARFKRDDWNGLRMLCDSIKVKDPMKVGRFGLGFKSVFHITDLPSVISNDRLRMIDPQETFVSTPERRRTGRGWHLKKDAASIRRTPDQFAPYKGIFNCSQEAFANGEYDGTLFRFPLRQEASRVSENVYSCKKIHGLYECFKAEAHLTLLFMKSLESIELYERGVDDKEPKKCFQVKISDSCLEHVREGRLNFADRVRQIRALGGNESAVSETYVMTVEATSYPLSGIPSTQQHTFVVTQYYSGNEASSELRELINEESLSYMPWVGVAAPLDLASSSSWLAAVDAQQPKGHIFCFLPLPLEQKSLTGLPVHVNGFFALSQNRRHLKWPSADQQQTDQRITDKSLLWNRCLLKEVLPAAYATLLLKMPRKNDARLLTAAYCAWPDEQKVDVKWKVILEPLFERFLIHKVAFSEVNGGKWLGFDSVILDKLDATYAPVITALLDAGQNIARLPRRVHQALDRYYTYYTYCKVKVITPKFVRDTLRSYPQCYKGLKRKDSIVLLRYILQDSNFEDLAGLALLPLANNTFEVFQRNGFGFQKKVYMPSDQHPGSLLRGLKSILLDTSIEVSVVARLHEVTRSGKTQLRSLDAEAVATHLKDALPSDWFNNTSVLWYPERFDHPSVEWFKQLWRYFVDHFPFHLNRFGGLPLIPVTPLTSSPVKMAPMNTTPVTLALSYKGDSLPTKVKEVLTECGITVVEELPQCIESHPGVVPQFVRRPDSQGVVEALVQVLRSFPQAFPRNLSLEHVRHLKAFLSGAKLSEPQKQVLRKLPVFETVGGVKGMAKHVSIENVPVGLESSDLPPVPLDREVINLQDLISRNLGQLLGVVVLQPMDLVHDLLYKISRSEMEESQVDALMDYVLSRLQQYNKKNNLKTVLMNITFVPVKGCRRAMPKDLFDPSKQSLKHIFYGEKGRFPLEGTYTERYLYEMRELGLKGEEQITADDILQSVKVVSSISEAPQANKKASTILEFLSTRENLLWHLCSPGGTLMQLLMNISWVPVLKDKPEAYPSCLPLKASGLLEKPMNVKTQKFAFLIGSTKPLIAFSRLDAKLTDAFGWNTNPKVQEVLEHLKNVVACYDVGEKAAIISVVKKIYDFLSGTSNVEVVNGLKLLGMSSWVWNGEGFCAPEDIVAEKPSLDLSPYLCTLPSETQGHRQLFLGHGMIVKCGDEVLLKVLAKIRDKHEAQTHPHANDTRRDLQMSIDILNELKPNAGSHLSEEFRQQLLIPLDNDDSNELQFAPVDDCTYCDVEWLKHGNEASDVDDELNIKFIHRNISPQTAEDLQVPTLMSRMLDAEELEFGESFGQYEPLTRRLQRLLEEYTDGFSVPKELIQNADDAGATEVRFLYDERANEDAMTCLISEGMKECQGPALWVYNNAVFTDADFQNITKLNGATKEEDSGKIGRFGLGFNAVYNITDVPSLLSRNNLVIFDPHTTHLGRAIRDKSRPGIKIDVTRSRQKRNKLANQLKPYNDIFGCNLRPDSDHVSFNGTLFRFPLRTKEQARRSEIKNLQYDHGEVVKLLQMFVSGAESLLLFTQNVCKVSVYHLPKCSYDASEPVELMTVLKSGVKFIRELDANVSLSEPAKELPTKDQKLIKQCNILKAATEALKHSEDRQVQSSVLLRTSCTVSESGRQLFDSNPSHVTHWLVTSTLVGDTAWQLAKRNGKLLPVAGAAAKLKQMPDGGFVPEPFTPRSIQPVSVGHVYCFLPLPIQSGLPVHINGSFATDSSRRHLREMTEDDKRDFGSEWNNVLMKEAVCHAYLTLLEDVKTVLPQEESAYPFHCLWPCPGTAASCLIIQHQFYKSLCSPNDPPTLFSDNASWCGLPEVVFLHPEFRHDCKIGEDAFQVFSILQKGKGVVVDVPGDVFNSFVESGCKREILKRCFNMYRAYKEVFLPAIESPHISDELKDKLILYALTNNEHGSEEVKCLIRFTKCIPTTPDGNTRKCPSDLIHPEREASKLFGEEDGRFPTRTYREHSTLRALVQLGMRRDDLRWDEIIDRAQSVQTLNERCTPKAYPEALSRAKAVLTFIGDKLANNNNLPSESEIKELQQVQFLPYLPKPENTPFKWKADEIRPHTFLAASSLYSGQDEKLISTTAPILDDTNEGCGRFTSALVKLLGIRKSVTMDQVKSQLQTVMKVKLSCLDNDRLDDVRKVCAAIYAYLERSLEGGETDLKQYLQSMEFILQDQRFLKIDQVAFRCPPGLAPYLHNLQKEYVKRFYSLFKGLGIRDEFGVDDYIRTLSLMNTKFANAALDPDSLRAAVEIAQLLGKLDGIDKRQAIYLPDSKSVLRVAKELSVKDCPWMPNEPGINYANEKIPFSTCFELGVNTRREDFLRRRSHGIPFGQKEKLTTRLKRILEGYPCDGAILKELLQNADDAKASKICFIKDLRRHPSERIFERSWKPLQGPALCVYNDSPFTTPDIEGIQRLGEGSKGDDPNKTGQYGVGFNAVYHMTDCPSFVSKGQEAGEIMCVFDPNLTFVPGATDEAPGRQYKELDHLRNVFSDVFPCYLGEHFPVENATMFRFPLRDVHMASSSKISNKPFDIEQLNKLVRTFKAEMFHSLLFVNNVREISLCEISEVSGQPFDEYKVTATLSPEDEKSLEEFAGYVKETSRILRKGSVSLEDVEKREVSYVVSLEDNQGKKQRWLVVQRCGFERDAEVPSCVNSAVKKQELGLLPRGGVATLLDSPSAADKKAFCFLPLPFTTGLPVHVNGHFALDHEARRNLWRSESEGDHRGAWNTMLLKSVVAPCYVTLLSEMRQHLGIQDTDAVIGRRKALQQTGQYLRLFPNLHNNEPYWDELAKEVYRYIGNKELPLLPVHRPVEDESASEKKEQDEQASRVKIEWFAPKEEGGRKLFFNDLSTVTAEQFKKDDASTKQPAKSVSFTSHRTSLYSDREAVLLTDTLLRSGLNLAEAPLNLFNNFKKSDVDVACVNPEDVLSFYHTGSNIECLPQCLEDTGIKNVENLLLVLAYCKHSNKFLKSLHGLPLLLTQDGMLKMFDRENPVFLTTHHTLTPRNASLFVHRNLFNSVFYEALSKSNVFKRFDIAAFAKLLPNNLERKYNVSDDFIEWDPISDKGNDLPSRGWLFGVWKLITSEMKDAIKNCVKKNQKEITLEHTLRLVQNVVAPLQNWCLLPVEETECSSLASSGTRHRQLLAPFSMSELVVSLPSQVVPFRFDSICGVLRKLALPEINTRVIVSPSNTSSIFESNADSLARLLVANVGNPRLILSALSHKLNKVELPSTITSKDCKDVLTYFNGNVTSLSPDDSYSLKTLPFHETVNGKHTSIAEMKGYVLPSEIPKAGLNIWERSGLVFLKGDQSLEALYQFLDCLCENSVDIYCEVILPRFQDMTQQAHIDHLEFLNGKLGTPQLQQGGKPDRNRLISSLSSLKFLPGVVHGQLKPASSFYDPRNDVFKIMLESKAGSFPPTPFNSDYWLSFLCKIGLIHIVSNQKFVEFAKEVANEAKCSRTDATFKKSLTLIEHLFNREDITTSPLLADIKNTKFVPPHKVSEALSRLCPPFGSNVNGELSYIPFNGSVLPKHETISWTSANILPRQACPCPWDIKQMLGIYKKPPVEVVVAHCLTISKRFAKTLNEDMKNLTEPCKIKDVMEALYDFLSTCADDVSVDRLKNAQCILVANGRRVVLPRQIVVQFPIEIPPYLYKIPLELGKFHELFKRLGATGTVTVQQYVSVLDMIHKECGNKCMDPNEMKSSLMATKGIFDLLSQSKQTPDEMEHLFLPGARKSEKDRVYLVPSHQLICDDAPHFRDRIDGFEEVLLIRLKDCGLENASDDTLVCKLPEKVRPQMMTQVVEERLLNNDSKACDDDDQSNVAARQLRQVINSDEFCLGFARLVKHEDYENQNETRPDILSDIKSKLASLRVVSGPELRTQLFYKEHAIPGSESKVDCFDEHSNTDNIVTLYVNTDIQSIQPKIAEVVNRIAGKVLTNLVYLAPLLSMPPWEISLYLDKNKIREDNSVETSYLPEPGSYVHLDHHFLLDNSFDHFHAGEYVGYEMDDPSLRDEDGPPTYIYAIVVEEIPGEESTALFLTRKYKINIGDDREVIADGIDLYKFRRPPDAQRDGTGMELVKRASESEVPPPKHTGVLKDALGEVTRVLEEAWKLPLETRRKIIKRLFLKWHPDKNPDDVEFCTKVFQHLQNEIQRLESGKASVFHSSGFSDFHGFSQRWGRRARSYGQSWSSYGTSRGYSGGWSSYRSSYVPRSSGRRNPQPTESRRWFRQAEADLAAVANDLGVLNMYYEWGCFKSHQAAEKALKAAQFSLDATNVRIHDLHMIARCLDDSTLSSLAVQLEGLVGNSMRMRYPDCMVSPRIPHDVYTRQQSQEAYCLAKEILNRVRERFFEMRQHLRIQDTDAVIGRNEALQQTEQYLQLFPNLHNRKQYWDELAKEVYRYIGDKEVPLLPVHRPVEDESASEKKEKDEQASRVKIEWEAVLLTDTLLRSGLNLAEAPLNLFNNFKKSDVDVACVNPEDVLSFYHTGSNIECLPQCLKDTGIKNVENLLLVLAYCKHSDKFLKSLHGLPLLLTQDGMLRMFDEENPVFLTTHHTLTPRNASLFVHRNLFNIVFYEALSKSNVFKRFDIAAFAKLLPNNLERKYNVSDEFIEWDPISDNKNDLPSGGWLFDVWKLMKSEIKDAIKNCVKQNHNEVTLEYKSRIAQNVVAPLQNWCLLPVEETECSSLASSGTRHRQLLAPFSMSKLVVSLPSQVVPFRFDSICGVLRKLALPEINTRVIVSPSNTSSIFESNADSLARLLVANVGNPRLILSALSHKLNKVELPSTITSKDCKDVLTYFNGNVTSLWPDDSYSLKTLPFHETVNGEHTSIAEKKVYVLPSEIPKAGLNIWERSGLVFLKGDQSLEALYQFLDFPCKNSVDIYCEVILPRFQDMTQQAHIDHLQFLDGKRFTLQLQQGGTLDRNRLISSLSSLKFLPGVVHGQLKPASSFYDPRNDVFKIMLESKAGSFCHIVSNQKFVEFAEEVADEAIYSRTDAIFKKSLTLIKQLFKRKDITTSSILVDIKNTKFVPPHKVSEALSRLCPPFGSNVNSELSYIPFNGSVLPNHETISWTSANILPRQACPPWPLRGIEQMLGIYEKPPVEVVVAHCLTISKRFAKTINGDTKNLTEPCKIKDVMEDLYDFLSTCADDVSVDRLKNAQCIFVADGRRVVLPRQIVVQFPIEIPPYLYKIPLELGKFHELFKRLGATGTVTVQQYVSVLDMIHKECGNKCMDPNEMKSSLMATKGIFDLLSQSKQTPDEMEHLFLPGARKSEKDRVYLVPSHQLICDDAPHFRDRIDGFKEVLLIRLKDCGLENASDDTLVCKLPEKVRPQMMTQIVEERLLNNDSKACDDDDQSNVAARQLRQVINSDEFCLGFARLVKHEDYENQNETRPDILSDIKSKLASLRVVSGPELRTQLFYKEHAIPGSESKVDCFDEHSNTDNIVTLYVNTDIQSYQPKIAEVVNRIAGKVLTNLLYLAPLLSMPPWGISLYLDKNNIREDNSVETSYLPEPGSYVHLDHHFLLDNSFDHFHAGEYVGYEMDDPSVRDEDGPPTYIYAIVVEEITGEESTALLLTRKYKINIGDYREVIADGIDLYKFRRPPDAQRDGTGMELVKRASESEVPPPKHTGVLKDALDEVTRVLEEAWKLILETRRKIIKRLFLKWHPDKNPDDVEFCTKVFQHLQNEIQRLESGKASVFHSSGFSDFHGFSQRWGRRARSYGQSWSSYGTSRGYSGGWSSYRSSYVPRSSGRRNPQPTESRRWFRQAEADLAAVANDLNMYYEWGCFKSHQAAEKALKAAQFSLDATNVRIHDLHRIASCLDDSTLSSLAVQLEGLVGNSMRMRYPDCMSSPRIPHDFYTRHQSREAYRLAEAILNRVKERFVDQGQMELRKGRKREAAKATKEKRVKKRKMKD